LSGWTPEQVEEARRWVDTWRAAGTALDRLRREELRTLDGSAAISAIAHLCGAASYREPPRAPKPTSGLIEQQRWFRRVKDR
jgi:hypothetical protein